MLPADQWPNVLANVRGTIVRGSERISSNRLLDALGVGDDPVLRAKVSKRLRTPMRTLGWHGPRPMRIPSENGHTAGCSGYWRSPSRLSQLAVPVEGAVEAEVEGVSDDLPDALEEVTRLGPRMLARVLRTPLDVTDASLTRSQVTAAIGAVNAQLRADEQRLRAKASSDVLERLLKIMSEERAKRARRAAAASLPQGKAEKDTPAPPDDDDEAS